MFGGNFEDVEFIANASVFVLLTAMKNKRLEAAGRISDGPRVNEAFDRQKRENIPSRYPTSPGVPRRASRCRLWGCYI
jgi:hypothetical protein